MTVLSINMTLLVVLGILIFMTARGYTRGLVKTFFGLFSTIVVLTLTFVIASRFSKAMIANDVIYRAVNDRIVEAMTEAGDNEEDERSLTSEEGAQGREESLVDKILSIIDGGSDGKVDEGLSELLSDYLSDGGTGEEGQTGGLVVPRDVLEIILSEGGEDGASLAERIQDSADETTEALKKEAVEYAADILTKRVISAVAFISVFLILSLIITILEHVLDIIAKLPVLKDINRLGGGAVGFVSGLIWVWLLFVLITTFMNTEIGQRAIADINNSVLLTILYRNNIIMNTVMKLVG